MDECVEKLLNPTDIDTFSKIALSTLRDSGAIATRTPTFAEITTSHNDQRTIGIVKIEGTASVSAGELP